ncbi:MAG: hypothetical protein QXH37_00525 [Candidatus Bathyarchaeia archaeon]
MLEILTSTTWVCFTVYAIWYFTSAKHYAPLTPNEAKILWKIHKQNAQCNAKAWRGVRRGGNLVGFECECGYKHIQKRLITANTPSPTIQQTSYNYNKLHKS